MGFYVSLPNGFLEAHAAANWSKTVRKNIMYESTPKSQFQSNESFQIGLIILIFNYFAIYLKAIEAGTSPVSIVNFRFPFLSIP